MNRKIPLFVAVVVVISCLFSQTFAEEGNASIRPVITTSMPNKMTLGLQVVPLHWYIIDDNLDNYTIYLNNSTWKRGNISSNLLEVQFYNFIGSYNLTLLVNDFSNYTASYQMVIIVSLNLQNSGGTSTNMQSLPMTKGPASPDFGFETSVAVLICLVVVFKLEKFNKKKS